ncbi:MAG TPA: DUF3619 family protein [Burkholderiaceae bacterium]|nr:DUF3619 family protein [Burkholderiaceae bacterium]
MAKSLALTVALTAQQSHDEFGQRIAARLTAGQSDIHHDISERLRIARQMAVSKRKRAPMAKTAGAVYGGGGSATLSFDDEGLSWWNRFASFLPLLALVAGLIAISDIQTTQQAQFAAELDADILTDTLPASAYVDPGFAQFLKMNADTTVLESQMPLTPLSTNEVNQVQEI